MTPRRIRALAVGLLVAAVASAVAPKSSVDLDISPDHGLAGENITCSLVFTGERILAGHIHMARYELDAAGCACARTAGVIDEHAGCVGSIEDRRANGHRGRRVGSL